MKLIYELSDISRTNQLRLNPDEDYRHIAEKLYQYLRKKGKGIDHFRPPAPPLGSSGKVDYVERHRRIKEEVKNRLLATGKPITAADIQYFLADSGGESHVFYLTPDTRHSGWIDLFRDGDKYREKIINLCFKLHLMSLVLPSWTITGFEELLIVHSSKEHPKDDKTNITWGHNVYVHLNKHRVLSLYLAKKKRYFQQKDVRTVDTDEWGDIIISPKGSKRYAFKSNGDGRDKNFIDFIRFDDKFPTTQMYYYQKLMTELELFFQECGIDYTALDFQADCYLEDPFLDEQDVSVAGKLDPLAIINNTGCNFSTEQMEFLRNFFLHQGVTNVQFGFSGQTVSEYERIPGENEEDAVWQIFEAIPWSTVKLKPEWNYLVFNKMLDKDDAGSMAYWRKEDNFWVPSSDIDDEKTVDFYSDLKRRYAYISTGAFYCLQGVNIDSLIPVGDDDAKDTITLLRYSPKSYKEVDVDAILAESRPFTNGRYLDLHESILSYLREQTDTQAWTKFCSAHKITVSTEFRKIISEMGIKSWIRAAVRDHTVGLPIEPQDFEEHEFWAIYVRSPKWREAMTAAVKFLYRNATIYIQDILTDTRQIRKRFGFLSTHTPKNNSDEGKLFDDQQYFADEKAGIYINCYSGKSFTPILIGRPQLLESVDSGTIKIDRTNRGEHASRILPLVMYYNADTSPVNKIQRRVCLDTNHDTFIQYYVPPRSNLKGSVKHAFRPYHLYGNTYTKKALDIETLKSNPTVALHFSTLTRNVLRIGENSQTSLLLKVARVLVEN